MKNKIIASIIVTSAIFISLSSCRVLYDNSGNVENISPTKLYEKQQENELKYDNISFKFTADVQIGTGNNIAKEEFSGNIRIQKDSIIWISLRMLGVEGARLVFTNDSIKILNRIDKTYYAGDFSYIKKQFNVDLDYDVMQSIILNSFFIYASEKKEEKKIVEKKFKNCIDTSLYCISSISERKYSKFYEDSAKRDKWERKLARKELGDTVVEEQDYKYNVFIFQTVKIYPDIFKMQSIYINDYIREQFLLVEYDEFFMTNEQMFPHKIFLEISTNETDMWLDLDIDNVAINTEKLSFPFKISSKYKKI